MHASARLRPHADEALALDAPHTGRVLRFYAGPAEIEPREPAKMSPFLRPEAFAAEPRRPMRVADAAAADVFVLPMTWGYYQHHGRLAHAIAFAREAAALGKRLVVWHAGDLEPLLPFENAILFLNGPVRSRRSQYQFAGPAFIDDPLPRYAGNAVRVRPWRSTPVVGFCGYASTGYLKRLYSMASAVKVRLMFAIGARAFRPPPIVPAAVLRARVLARLRASRDVETRFVIRDRYKAGHRKARADDPSVVEFFANVLETDYSVCVRGFGNWSQRFYEVLACGRVPIVVDTDVVMPFDGTVDWKRLCVWVHADEIARIGEIVASFHRRLSDSGFAELQHSCRRLWEERLTVPGFLAHVADDLSMVPESQAAAANVDGRR